MNLCKCGCGAEVKGSYVHGHNRRGAKLTPEHLAALAQGQANRVLTDEGREGIRAAFTKAEDEIGYSTWHYRLRRERPLTGVCTQCGKTTKTEHAYSGPNGEFSTNMDDYTELCLSCHRRMDRAK